MGRTRTTKTANNSKDEPPTVAALIEKAEKLIIECNYDLARLFINRILEREPANAQAKEMLGVVQLESGDIQAAKQTFMALVSLSVPSAHFYLGQLNDDDPHLALQHYQSAVDILSVQLKGKAPADGSDDDELEIKSNIVKGLLAQVELWMDPSYTLCDEPDADKKCEQLIAQALQVDPGNAEALQTLASVRLSQSRPEDAKQCLEQSWSAWKDLDLDNPKVPPIPARLALVKLFLELALFPPAIMVLHGIMSSDDEEVDAWYLEGYCYFLMSENAQKEGGSFEEMTWEELAKEARDRLETCHKLHVMQQHPDAPMLDHVNELTAQLDALGIKASAPGDDDDDDGSGGEWGDVNSDDEDVEMS